MVRNIDFCCIIDIFSTCVLRGYCIRVYSISEYPVCNRKGNPIKISIKSEILKIIFQYFLSKFLGKRGVPKIISENGLFINAALKLVKTIL